MLATVVSDVSECNLWFFCVNLQPLHFRSQLTSVQVSNIQLEQGLALVVFDFIEDA
jgi:hypothetical protein